MLNIKGAIVVEGKYDKARVARLVSCPVIATNGFRVFKNPETVSLLRHYAQNGGIIILTDSDSAGFKIRSYIKGIISHGTVKNAYIPDIYGKERRKVKASAEGKLGVEGVPDDVIINALKAVAEENPKTGEITKLHLYELGYFGRPDSAAKRQALQKALNLPERLTPNSLLDALNAKYSHCELCTISDSLFCQNNANETD